MNEGRFHIENNRLVKTSNGEAIPDDEPVFIMRGRDHLAIRALGLYRKLAMDDQCNDYFMGEIDKVIDRFNAFAAEHPERMKQPGITRGK